MKNNEKKYKIGEFSNLSGLSVTTLRYYNQIGLLIPSMIDPYTGYRYYTDYDLDKVEYINTCKAMGFQLEEIVDSVNHELTLDQLEEKENELLDRKQLIENQIVKINEYKRLRKSSVKVLRKVPNDGNKIAC